MVESVLEFFSSVMLVTLCVNLHHKKCLPWYLSLHSPRVEYFFRAPTPRAAQGPKEGGPIAGPAKKRKRAPPVAPLAAPPAALPIEMQAGRPAPAELGANPPAGVAGEGVPDSDEEPAEKPRQPPVSKVCGFVVAVAATGLFRFNVTHLAVTPSTVGICGITIWRSLWSSQCHSFWIFWPVRLELGPL